MTSRLLPLLFCAHLAACGGSSTETGDMLDGGASEGDGAVESPACGAGFEPCDEQGVTCETEAERCTCELGAGLAWACEPLECDSGEPVEGESCSAEDQGLRCDAGFEDLGNVCRDGRWVACLPLRLDATSGVRVWCPEEPPVEGDPCCVETTFPSPPPDECPYESETFRCAVDAWVKVSAP